MADFEGVSMEAVEEYTADLESIMQCEPLITKPGVDRSSAQYLFTKELKRSDVGPTHRIVIPKVLDIDGLGFLQKDAKMYLPPLTDKGGLFMLVDDMDIDRIWTFRYRFRENSQSRMFILEKTGDFVKEHGLRAGDFIMIYKFNERETYGIRCRKTISLEAPRQNEKARSMNDHQTPLIWDEIDAYFPPESSSMFKLSGGLVPNDQNYEQPVSFQPTTFPAHNF